MNNAKRTCSSRLVEGAALQHYAPHAWKQAVGSDAYDALQLAPLTYHCPHYPAGHRVPRHHHQRAQLLYAVSGIMTVETDSGTWTVPPEQAVWIPPGISHEVRMPCPVSMRSLYIRPGLVDSLPDTCQVVAVTPLLRELIARLVTPFDYDRGRIERLMGVLVDEVLALEGPSLHLPAPHDPRLRFITDRLIAEPADTRELCQWADEAGASSRTIARLFKKETGLGFRAWREQRRLLAAIERLAAGESVTRVALDLGYHSPSAFIAMFRRRCGDTPGRFVAGGHTGR